MNIKNLAPGMQHNRYFSPPNFHVKGSVLVFDKFKCLGLLYENKENKSTLIYRIKLTI